MSLHHLPRSPNLLLGAFRYMASLVQNLCFQFCEYRVSQTTYRRFFLFTYLYLKQLRQSKLKLWAQQLATPRVIKVQVMVLYWQLPVGLVLLDPRINLEAIIRLRSVTDHQ